MKYLYLFLAALMLCSCSASKKGTRVPAPAVQNTSEITNIEQPPVNPAPAEDYVIIGGYRTNYTLSRASSIREFSMSIAISECADFTGIEHFTNLEVLSLYLWETDAIDFSPLKSLSKLKNIYIRGSALTEIPDLDGISSLVIMELDNNSLTSFKGIEMMPQLEWLIIDNARLPITNTSALRYLRNLHLLHIYNLSFNIDLLSFADSSTLEEIYFSNCGELDLTGIGQLRQLEKLFLSIRISEETGGQGTFKNIEEIGRITGLKELHLDELITSVEFLANNVNLEHLELVSGKARPGYYTGETLPLDVAPLGNLKKLKYLAIRGFELINAHVLDTLPELQRINTALWDPE
jgi:Leucine-rich repeat (LRR) protein